jgi:tRNA/tmRNA/rRNA uracil-C5-methylase (TrmA/RlmC/RlmD family)
MGPEVELHIDDIAFGGKGVGRVGQKAVFVPFTIPGERIRARIRKEKKSFAEAELTRLIDPSAERTTPRCPYFGHCGGCSYQHMQYEHQLHWKERQVRETLRRIGKLEEIPVHPIVRSPQEYEYRNRITVHVEDGVIGFFRHGAHRLIDIEECPIAQPAVNAELKALRARRLRPGHYTLRAYAGPRVFSQINDPVAIQLADTIATSVPPDQTLLIDAYCGSGFFARHLLGNFLRVVGIDWDRHAISAAQEQATSRENYLAGDLDELLREQLIQAELGLTTVIVDPPATGLSESVRAILHMLRPATLFYVSCNPATLARDLAGFEKVYNLISVTPFDMFPQTAEIEALAHLGARP